MRKPISKQHCDSTLTTPSYTPVMPIFWSDSIALSKQQRKSKRPSAWTQSLHKLGIAMAHFWRNTANSTRQLCSIDRRFKLTRVMWMLISIWQVRFSKRAICRKPRHIIWREAGSSQSSPNLTTTWEKFSCAKATFPARLRNSKKRYVFIPTFRRRRRICAAPEKPRLSLVGNRRGKIFGRPRSAWLAFTSRRDLRGKLGQKLMSGNATPSGTSEQNQ